MHTVAGVDEGEGVGRNSDLVLLLNELAAPLEGEEAHLVEDLVGDQLPLEGRGQLPWARDAPEDVVVVAVAVAVVALDHVLDSLVV